MMTFKLIYSIFLFVIVDFDVFYLFYYYRNRIDGTIIRRRFGACEAIIKSILRVRMYRLIMKFELTKNLKCFKTIFLKKAKKMQLLIKSTMLLVLSLAKIL